ncbi:hypothetical protein MRBBS_2616 [Marinobacter sp. BSs20148]|nr:hypothetical protein MRBBS_2616 [Marinobacter sp. BSs20148]
MTSQSQRGQQKADKQTRNSGNFQPTHQFLFRCHSTSLIPDVSQFSIGQH